MSLELRILLSIAVIVIAVYLIFKNTYLDVEYFTLKANEKLRITHLSDIHNNRIGYKNGRLIETVKKTKPDIIALTGDLLDKRRPDEKICYDLIDELVKIAPIYFVRGNHEVKADRPEFIKTLKKKGVIVLENETRLIGKNINLIGVDDLNVMGKHHYEEKIEYLHKQLNRLVKDSMYNLVLIHQPQLLDEIGQHNVDLVLSGHAHGGQVIIPFIGAIFAPSQGFFPKYYSGKYESGKTTMLLSRGIGSSIIPIRVNDDPHIIVIDLEK